MFKTVLFIVAILALNASQCTGHGVMLQCGMGDGVSVGLGVVEDTDRDSTSRRVGQQDSSIMRDEEIEDGGSPCGRTLGEGDADIAAGIQAALNTNIANVEAGGTLRCTMHQVNADGAGPYECQVSQNGQGTDFGQPIAVTLNVPGTNGRDRNGNTTPHPMEMVLPANMNCSGGPTGDVCLVRCRNDVRAGPFGGCAPVRQQNGNNNNNNNNNNNQGNNNNGNQGNNNNNQGNNNNNQGNNNNNQGDNNNNQGDNNNNQGNNNNDNNNQGNNQQGQVNANNFQGNGGQQQALQGQ